MAGAARRYCAQSSTNRRSASSRWPLRSGPSAYGQERPFRSAPKPVKSDEFVVPRNRTLRSRAGVPLGAPDGRRGWSVHSRQAHVQRGIWKVAVASEADIRCTPGGGHSGAGSRMEGARRRESSRRLSLQRKTPPVGLAGGARGVGMSDHKYFVNGGPQPRFPRSTGECPTGPSTSGLDEPDIARARAKQA